jgi:dipeptidyl aminopeptidase/acylaminoacyl peptidase
MQFPIQFKSDEFEIFGIMHMPSRICPEKPIPGIVFCHGFTGTKVEANRLFVTLSRKLEKSGIASLRFDYRGCGDSSGDFVQTTVLGEVKDTCNAVDFLRKQPGIDKKRIGVLGLSLGGAVAAYAAGRRKCVKALALWAPAADLMDEEEQIKSEEEIKEVKKYKAVDYYGTLLGKDFIEEMPKIKPVNAVKKYSGATVILHGTNDMSVPLGHSLRYYNVLKRKKLHVERHLIEDADHVFSSYEWEEKVLSKTLKFFLKYL